MNLFLIGYRGTGKTTLGKLIAQKLSKEFIDLDELIVKKTNKTIPEIFSSVGEAKFREYETNALIEACGLDANNEAKTDKVISCGGGIVMRKENTEILKRNGFVVLLKATPETIFARIYKDKNRPALTNKKPMEEIKHMLHIRKDAYNTTKNYEVWTDREKAEKSATRVIEEYLKRIK